MVHPTVEVDTPRVREIAETVHRVGLRVGDRREDFVRQEIAEAEVFGYPATFAAYHEFHQAWALELHVMAGALQQLSAALARAAGNYQLSDVASAERFQ